MTLAEIVQQLQKAGIPHTCSAKSVTVISANYTIEVWPDTYDALGFTCDIRQGHRTLCSAWRTDILAVLQFISLVGQVLTRVPQQIPFRWAKTDLILISSTIPGSPIIDSDLRDKKILTIKLRPPSLNQIDYTTPVCTYPLDANPDEIATELLKRYIPSVVQNPWRLKIAQWNATHGQNLKLRLVMNQSRILAKGGPGIQFLIHGNQLALHTKEPIPAKDFPLLQQVLTTFP